jgi:hypothetical protein
LELFQPAFVFFTDHRQPGSMLFMSAAVDLVAQQLGAPENDHPPLGQHHIAPGCGIATPSGLFCLDAEFPESTYQNIFAIFHLAFDNLKQGFYDFNAFFSGDTEFFGNSIDYLSFGQGHG